MINMNYRLFKAFVYYMIMCWLLTACNSQTRYHQFRYINNQRWSLSDTIKLDVPLTDSLHNHQLTIQLRHTAHYPYKNLSINLLILSPDSLYTKKESFSVNLIDEEGNWISRGQGGLYHLNLGETLLPPSIRGDWHISIIQAMGDSILPGIHDLGIEVSVLPTSIYSQEDK